MCVIPLVLLVQIFNNMSLKLLDIKSMFRVVAMFAPAGSHMTMLQNCRRTKIRMDDCYDPLVLATRPEA
jgi:hypothetical protein